MINKTSIPLFLLSILALASAPGYAQKLVAEPYVGFGYGQYRLEFDTGVDDDEFDDEQDAWKIYLGTQLTEAFGAEITGYDFSGGRDSSLESDLEGASIAALFHAPLFEDRFSLFAKVGWFWWEADVETTVPGDPILSEDFDGNDLFFGVGAQLGLTDTLKLRLEYDRFELDEDINPELDYASASIQFHF